jgi:hypothetical protein
MLNEAQKHFMQLVFESCSKFDTFKWVWTQKLKPLQTIPNLFYCDINW